MKKLLIAASVFTYLLSSAAFAQAATNPQSQQSQQALQQQDQWPTPPASTLTRAQVEQALALAQKDGELHYLNTEIYQGS